VVPEPKLSAREALAIGLINKVVRMMR